MTSLYETAVAQAQRSRDQLRDDTDRAAQKASMLATPQMAPPWVAMLQALADQAENEHPKEEK